MRSWVVLECSVGDGGAVGGRHVEVPAQRVLVEDRGHGCGVGVVGDGDCGDDGAVVDRGVDLCAGEPGEGGRGDLGVGEQRVLDDRGVDVVTTPDDQVLGPAGEVDESFLIEAGQVAGVQPAVD